MDAAPRFRFRAAVPMRVPNPSAATTPRTTPRTEAAGGAAPPPSDPYSGVPEGLLSADTQLTASFSAAPTNVQSSTPVISSMDLSADGGFVSGDVLGHVAVYARAPDNPGEPVQHVVRYTHQAFLPEFDCLKSTHIEERVKCCSFLPSRSPNVVTYLAANERTIKMFRMRDGVAPTRHKSKAIVPLRAFTSVHQFQIHAVSLCADQETFLSADDFQIYWWHLEAEETTRAACIADIKPDSMDDISQLLTAARFHPSHGSLFATATSSGHVLVGDLRHPPSVKPRRFPIDIALRPQHNEVQCSNDDILCSVSDVAFSSGNHLVTRDYLGLKLWDIRRPDDPVASCTLLRTLIPHLDYLYDCDAIFDRFSLAADIEGSGIVVSGLYDGTVAVWDSASANDGPATEHDNVEYYTAGTLTPPDAFPDGGRTGPLAVNAPPPKGGQFLTTKVQALAIAPGGRSFSFALEEHAFTFERIV